MNIPCSMYPVVADEYDLKQISAFAHDSREIFAYLTQINAYDYVNDKRLRKALEYIKTNYQQTIIQAEVARYVGLTPSKLAKLFREQTYMTFTQIVNEVRVAHAAALIYKTNDSLEVIAFNCGFATERTFTREFRQCIGFTPVDFRDSCKRLIQGR